MLEGLMPETLGTLVFKAAGHEVRVEVQRTRSGYLLVRRFDKSTKLHPVHPLHGHDIDGCAAEAKVVWGDLVEADHAFKESRTHLPEDLAEAVGDVSVPPEVASLITAMWNNVDEFERPKIVQQVERLKGEPEAIVWLAARAVQKLLSAS